MPRSEQEALFDRLYEAHFRILFAFLVGRTGDRELAKELLQETFLRGWRHLPMLAGIDSVEQRRWLIAVARNAATDAARAAAVRARTPDFEPPPVRDVEAEVDEREDLRAVGQAMRGLPPDLREVLVLQALGGMSSAEIGEALGRPSGTVRWQTARARRLLAEHLSREGALK
jgi:RNA polymerase sigma-70 factor (ECF subfamily)